MGNGASSKENSSNELEEDRNVRTENTEMAGKGNKDVTRQGLKDDDEVDTANKEEGKEVSQTRRKARKFPQTRRKVRRRLLTVALLVNQG